MLLSPENLASVDEAVTVTDTSYPQVDSVTIDWGNGRTQSVKQGSNTPYRYDKNGTYTVTLIASNAAGSDSVSQTIRVGDLGPLTPSFITTPTKAVAGQSVMFIDTSAGGPTSWSWSFGDGGSGDGPVATHVYAKDGLYEVTLKVARFGPPQEVKANLQVGPSRGEPKGSVWITGPASLSVNQSGAFRANTTGEVKTITWDFGDGASAVGADVTHVFSAPGPKTVTAKASGPAGSASDAFAVQVDPVQPLHADFVMNPAVPVQNSMLSFTNLSTGNPDSFTWSTSGGVFSTSADATYFVVDQPSLTITLKACKGQVCDSKTASTAVTPNENLVAIFTFAPAPEAGVGQTVAFNDKSSGGPDRLMWTFGDDNSSSAQRNPTHVFAKEGFFPVTLVACRGTQCVTTVQAVTVKASAVPEPGTVSFTATPAAPTAGQTVTLTAAISPDPPVSANWTINGVSVTSSGVHMEYVMQAVPQGTYDIILSVCWNADRGLDPGQGNCHVAQKSLVVNPASANTPPNPGPGSTTPNTSPPPTNSTTSSSTTSSTSTTAPTTSSSTATTSPTTSSPPTTSSSTTSSSTTSTSSATTSSTTTTAPSTSSSTPPSSSGSATSGTSSTATSAGSTQSAAPAGSAPGASSITKP
jgi:PKD repeat protein